MNKPLDGVKVLSLVENLPGPYATMVLADLGADVIAVERPGSGDPGRQVPAMFASTGRGKKSVVLDLKSPRGKARFLSLASDADVVIEGFRPGVVDRLGVGYEKVRAVNESIVYVSLSGFGQDGPYRDRPAHDIVYQAVAGLLAGHVPGTGRGAVPEVLTADMAAGTFAVVAVTTALVQKARTGRGSRVDVSMLDVLVSWMTPVLALSAADAQVRLPLELPGYGLYRTLDGVLIALGVTLEDHLWRELCRACGLDELMDVGAQARADGCRGLDDRLRETILGSTWSHWDRRFSDAGVAYARVNTIEQVAEDPQVRARRLVLDLTGDHAGHASVRQPLVFDRVVDAVDLTVPQLGQDDDRV